MLLEHAQHEYRELLHSRQRSRILWRRYVGPIFLADFSRATGSVLVVDDHEAVRTSFAQILETEGFEVLQAVDGLAALSVLKDTSVSAMVLDVAMPVLDGFGLLDKLDDPPPVIMVTARIYDVEVAKRRDKIFGFVSRPVPPDELISLVKRAVLAGGFRS